MKKEPVFSAIHPLQSILIDFCVPASWPPFRQQPSHHIGCPGLCPSVSRGFFETVFCCTDRLQLTAINFPPSVYFRAYKHTVTFLFFFFSMTHFLHDQQLNNNDYMILCAEPKLVFPSENLICSSVLFHTCVHCSVNTIFSVVQVFISFISVLPSHITTKHSSLILLLNLT